MVRDAASRYASMQFAELSYGKIMSMYDIFQVMLPVTFRYQKMSSDTTDQVEIPINSRLDPTITTQVPDMLRLCM